MRKEVDPLSPFDGARGLLQLALTRTEQLRNEDAYRALIDAIRFVPGGWAHHFNLVGNEPMELFDDAAAVVLAADHKLPEATVFAKLAAQHFVNRQPSANVAGRNLAKSYASRVRQVFRVLIDLLLRPHGILFRRS